MISLVIQIGKGKNTKFLGQDTQEYQTSLQPKTKGNCKSFQKLHNSSVLLQKEFSLLYIYLS